MKLPLSWLKEYIKVSVPSEKLADLLTMSGTKVEHVENKNGEAVIQIEVTTNRPDCLSILGLAREVSVLTGQKIKWPKILKQAPSHGKKLEIRVLDKKGCPLYTARLIENVSISPSPVKAQKFLELVGTRAINNAVDATNFVLFETGQPLHAFDYDKIKGGVIIVRRAVKGEKFLSLDGIEHALEPRTLVIADAEKPIAIAGVIGGKLTEVTQHTKNILLESAYFDPRLVREASRLYKISTDSSYRFERGVDRENVTPASARARDLILEWAGGVETGAHAVELKAKKKNEKINLRVHRIEKLLGLVVKPARAAFILNSLGLKTKVLSQDKLTVLSSGARRDIACEEDIVEEVLRVEGFDKVPVVVPATRRTSQKIDSARVSCLLELKKFISNLGFNEIISYSFLSEKSIKDSGLSLEDQTKPHKIVNALSGELQYFRSSLLPGMLANALFNIHRKADALRLFEIGNRYLNGKEETALSLCLYGDFENSWQRKSESSFFDLKGSFERIFTHLNLENTEWIENSPCPKYAVSSSAYIGDRKLGTIGILSAEVLKNWDIPHPVIYGEIVLDPICEKTGARLEFKASPIPKFPLVRRDIAFVIGRSIPVGILQDLILKSGAPYLKEANLFDQYIGKNIAAGKRSLAFSLCYQKETGTFTDEEINSLQAKVTEALKREFQIELR